MSKGNPDGWVARDESGYLGLYYRKPTRNLDKMWEDEKAVLSGSRFIQENSPLGKELTWEDEPRPLYLIRRNPDDVARLVVAANVIYMVFRVFTFDKNRLKKLGNLAKALEPFKPEVEDGE